MTDNVLGLAGLALPPTRVLIAAWMLLASAQMLASAAVYGPSGILPWSLLAQERGRPRLAPFRRLMSVARLRAVLIGHIAAAIVLAASARNDVTIACLAALLIGHSALILLSGDSWAGGATKMGMIAMAGAVLLAVGVREAAPDIALAGLLVAGGQLVLCYAVSGFSKLATATWRNGTELQRAMAEEGWGHPFVAALTAHRPIAIAASWGVMLVEALFPLALLAPAPWLFAALAVMLAFHVTTAVVMGLNLFPWAFVATYPAVVGLSWAIRGAS